MTGGPLKAATRFADRLAWMLCIQVAVAVLSAQSPLANIEGRILDRGTLEPIAEASVGLTGTGGSGVNTKTSNGGRYLIPLQPPGVYEIRISANGYQPQILSSVELHAGALLTIDFQMRPSDDILDRGQFRTWSPQGSRAVLMVPGPDLDTGNSIAVARPLWSSAALTPTLSESIDPLWLRDFPLAGRDAYTLLVFLPSVSSDSATSRGLGFTPNGQRPTSTHFLLDGQENDDSTVTGPRVLLPPEAVGEYRAAIGNFSAEFGGTTGLVANAVTKSGGSVWHGGIYGYLKNEALNANGFQENRLGLPRNDWKELHLGANAGGPLIPERLFLFGSFERFRSRRREDPEEIELPTQNYKNYTAPGSFARSILDRFGNGVLVASADPNAPLADVSVARPLFLDNSVGLLRLDYAPRDSRVRSFLRLMGSRQVRPDFIWSPYPGFGSTLFQTDGSALAGTTVQLSSSTTFEWRGSYAVDDIGWDRPHSEIPSLSAGDTVLPGSPAFYAYRNRNSTWETSGALQTLKGAHLVKFGLAALYRRQNSLMTPGRDGLYLYGTYFDFGADWPLELEAATPRLGGTGVPAYEQRYNIGQWSGYLQDDWRIAPGTSIYLGIRYEYFGVPSAANPEVVIQGASLGDARFETGTGALYEPDRNNVGFRAGLSQRTKLGGVFRLGAGVFFDRGFDNLWQTVRSNSFTLQALPFFAPSSKLGLPVRTLLAQNEASLANVSFPDGVLLQRDLRSPYAWNSFVTQEIPLSRWTRITVGGQSSLGRKLITTDRINRLFSIPAAANNPYGELNPGLPTVEYRGNQGVSSFWALNTGLRYASASRAFVIQYCWSHTIDVQSDALAGDFFDVNFANVQFQGATDSVAAFSQQFNPKADRGNSSFDQRHVFSAMATTPLWAGVRLASFFSLRSGLPYTVLADGFTGFDQQVIYGLRPDLVNANGLIANVSAPGGRQVLNQTAFADSQPGSQGDLGRNSLREPGFLGLDISVRRQFHPWRSSDRGPSLLLRADAFNVLNHTNLGIPNHDLGASDFGVAPYGRIGTNTGFPGLSPLSETARQIQLSLKLEF